MNIIFSHNPHKVKRGLILITAAVLLTFAAKARGNAPNLTAYWPFDPDVEEGHEITDVTGNGYDAVRNGGTSLLVNGIEGKGMSFDGVDGYLNVPQGVVEGHDVGNFGTDDFTLSFWMKTTATRREGVIGKRVFCQAGSFFDLRLLTDMTVELYHDNNPDNRNSFSGLRVLNDGIWHQLVLTREGMTATLYVDGKLDRSNTHELVTNIDNSADFWIGRSACTSFFATYYFTGVMDEIRVYEGAMSCEEVRAAYETYFDVLDLNRDMAVDFADFVFLAGEWLETGRTGQDFNPISPADVAPGCGDGRVNLADYAAATERI